MLNIFDKEGENNPKNDKKKEEKKVQLELGYIIQIYAPNNDKLNFYEFS